VVFPASLVVIDQSAFFRCNGLHEVALATRFFWKEFSRLRLSPFPEGGKIVTFEGPPLLSVMGTFLCSQDSGTMLKLFARR
jgi:hypothetical protein